MVRIWTQTLKFRWLRKSHIPILQQMWKDPIGCKEWRDVPSADRKTLDKEQDPCDPDRQAGAVDGISMPHETCYPAICPFCGSGHADDLHNDQPYCARRQTESGAHRYQIICGNPSCGAKGPPAWDKEQDPVALAWRLWGGHRRTPEEIKRLAG